MESELKRYVNAALLLSGEQFLTSSVFSAPSLAPLETQFELWQKVVKLWKKKKTVGKPAISVNQLRENLRKLSAPVLLMKFGGRGRRELSHPLQYVTCYYLHPLPITPASLQVQGVSHSLQILEASLLHKSICPTNCSPADQVGGWIFK